jgi:hypothetical protein
MLMDDTVMDNTVMDDTGLNSAVSSSVKVESAWSLGLTIADSIENLQHGLREQPLFDRSKLADLGGYAAADPFAIQRDGVWYVFFEMLVRNSNAVIAVASSRDLDRWELLGVCLRQPYHLSYPFVCEYGDDIFMVPESKSARQVVAYRATQFPMQWEPCTTLARGRLMDATIVPWKGKYWMLAAWHSYWLRAFWSDSPIGPYRPHWLPCVRTYSKKDVRPGGRIVTYQGQLLRPVQDNRGGYGRQLRAMVIERMDRKGFIERPLQEEPILQPAGKGWFAQKIHHLDLHPYQSGWLGFVDGCN